MTKEHNQELVDKYYTRGLEHSREGDHELAIENYTKAIELNPKAVVAYEKRGITYYNKGQILPRS